MLIYHPAFDAHHSAFRQLVLLSAMPESNADQIQLRILDFYFLFPAELRKVTFPNALRKEKKQWTALATRYNRILDPRRIFDELRAYQDEGLRMLAATGIVRITKGSRQSSVALVEIPQSIYPMIESARSSHANLLNLLAGEFSKIDLYGASGLKDRTGLFEYRYDAS